MDGFPVFVHLLLGAFRPMCLNRTLPTDAAEVRSTGWPAFLSISRSSCSGHGSHSVSPSRVYVRWALPAEPCKAQGGRQSLLTTNRIPSTADASMASYLQENQICESNVIVFNGESRHRACIPNIAALLVAFCFWAWIGADTVGA